jgi:hypothetical protein
MVSVQELVWNNGGLQARKGFFGQLIGWFIRVVIYDICVTTIQEILGVNRLLAIFIFLGILLLISFGGYVMKQKISKQVDEY